MGSDRISVLALTVPLAGIVGLFVGSFLNVVIYRAPLGLSVATPRSFCPTCDRQLLVVGEHPGGLVVGAAGAVPHLPRAHLRPIPPGRVVHRLSVRPGHLGLARHDPGCRLLRPGRRDDRRRTHRVRRDSGRRCPWPPSAPTGRSRHRRRRRLAAPLAGRRGFVGRHRRGDHGLRYPALQHPDCARPAGARPERPALRRAAGPAGSVSGRWPSGLAAWIVTYLPVLVGVWAVSRQTVGSGPRSPSRSHRSHRCWPSPWCRRSAWRMAASLIVAG